MRNFLFKILALSFIVAVFFKASAQSLNATDTSAPTVKHYQSLIKNNKQIVKYIEYTFVKKGLPKHLRNLAIIESGLNRNIVSAAGATGLWQFMSDHANQYGLTEEGRSDVYKSTQTAAVSLNNLYKKYQNWVTVVAAYNCGENNVKKAMVKAGSKIYTDFEEFLPAETQNHVRKYLNAAYATGELGQVLADYRQFSGAKKSVKPFTGNSASKSDLAQTTINVAYNLTIIAKYLKVELSAITSWNPGLVSALNSKGESEFYLPRDKMLLFQKNKNKILSESLAK